MVNEIGEILIELENVSKDETNRLRDIIHILLAQGTLNIRNGHAIIHFDNDGNLQKIDHEFIKWKRTPNLTQAGKR